MFCTNCGSVLPDNTQICPNCGKPLAAPNVQVPAQPSEADFTASQVQAPVDAQPADYATTSAFSTSVSPEEAFQIPQPSDTAQPYYSQQPTQQGFGAQQPTGAFQQPGETPASPYVAPGLMGSQSAPKKSNLPKIIGIIAAVVVALLVLGAILGGGDKDTDTTVNDPGTGTIDDTSTSDGTDSGTDSGTSDDTNSDDSWFDDVDVTTDDGTNVEEDNTPVDPDADLTPQEEPASGEVLMGGDLEPWSEITIKANEEKSCYVKLKDESGNDVFAFYVRAGEEATVGVPAGMYYVYFASGDTWYGTEDLFGSGTDYSMDPEINDLNNYTLTYTLHAVEGGNFQTEDIPEGEF